MNSYFTAKILQATHSVRITKTETIQELWSGYGKILRVYLEGGALSQVVVKHIATPKNLQNQYHPRGWNTNIGHQRKLKSYKVESEWYASYSKQSKARLPKCIGIENFENEVVIILEDLNLSGYDLRKDTPSWQEISICLDWLAAFHASFLQVPPKGLWQEGTYWHLATRTEEWEAITDAKLKSAAIAIDQKLKSCKYQTLVHGDAKLANFCFSANGTIAGVDFQYVGAGCGMKDVAYFISSCLLEKDCERLETQILDQYFRCLQQYLPQPNLELEKEWRSLYRVAWADFHRFLKGWSPQHWKVHSYSSKVCNDLISTIYDT